MRKRLVLVVTTLAVAAAGSAAYATGGGTVDAADHIAAGGTSTGALLNGSIVAAFNCTAAATGPAVSVAITRCALSTGGPNEHIGLPGAAATIAGTATIPLAKYTLCYTATATYVDGFSKTVSACNPLLPTAGGVPPLSNVGVAVN